VLWFGPISQLRQLSSVSSAITINRNIIKPSSVVRDLGVLFDAELSMRQHVLHVSQTSAPARLTCVTDVCASTSHVCHRPLHQHVSHVSQTSAPARLACVTDVLLSSAPHTLSPSSTRLQRHCQDGYNFGAVAPRPLQRCSCGFAGDGTSPSTDSLACSSSTPTVVGLKLRYHVTPALQELHLLPITERIQYKLCLLVHKMFVGHTPDYIASLLMPASDIPSRSSLR